VISLFVLQNIKDEIGLSYRKRNVQRDNCHMLIRNTPYLSLIKELLKLLSKNTWLSASAQFDTSTIARFSKCKLLETYWKKF